MPPTTRRPAPPRLRRGRAASAALSCLVTVVAVLGAVGILPDGGRSHPAEAAVPAAAGSARLSGQVVRELPGRTDLPRSTPALQQRADVALPPRSGEGRRVVFSMSRQRVWLVGGRDRVQRTYLVSGSLSDNLHAGSYAVFSRSRHAIGIDDSGTMGFMVRFTTGRHAAIGFHDIPVKDGHRLQTRAQLGTPQSHGCIRQARPDARALWRFAPVDTPVVVTG